MAPPKKTDSNYEERIQNAMRTIRAGDESSVPAARDALDVNRRTLHQRLAGTTVSRIEAHEEKQRLTSSEENAIVKWCFSQDDIGFPPRLDMVKTMVLHLEKKCSGVQPPLWANIGFLASPKGIYS
ncbi:hypothetical protein HOY80DRAFT_1052509 [Tuber brumale]|nr:hypothetical protein HOY80DRAFT_1052509 [Tuber brumale]